MSATTTLSNQSRPTVLVVDDNIPFIKRIVSLLQEVRNIGHINIASEFNEATRIFKEQQPDVVLLDISMPGQSGMKLLKQFKTSGVHCEVIMLTNHAEDCYRNHCHDLGVDYFLDKSHDFVKIPHILSLIEPKQKPLHKHHN
jgi:DNA-binding NarL/FixJ family response regulator